MGTYALSAGYYDAYYKRAQQVQTDCSLVKNVVQGCVLFSWKKSFHFGNYLFNIMELNFPGQDLDKKKFYECV